jgi:SAM-dependent methyltransferase
VIFLRPGEGERRDIDRDERRAVERALRATGDVRSILDVGAGNGRWLPTLTTKKGAFIVALDSSRAELSSARSSAGPDAASWFSVVAADAGALPFRSQSFDLVLCLGVMPFVRRSGRLRSLREMRRVTGRWVVVEYAHCEGMAFFWQRVRKRLGLPARFPRNHLSSIEIQNEFRRAGLGIRGFARVGGMFSRTWVVLAEAPSPDWMKH